ncbi:hypothetical protein lbkm_2240 [Lachnospiraceae bacterium KM106-2]|nr:hypothetical protein lbkm_2240 [Lachnospiraceae bacterium KM106-2]
MKCVEYGEDHKEIIIFLHGGGLAPWNYSEEAEQLKDKYHIIIPILDGHSGSDRNFTTIESNADEIIKYIDEKCFGKIFMIGGLSLGGQILVEILSKRKNICKFAIIESALVLPMRTTFALIRPTISLSYPLIKKSWFARLQFNSLHIKKDFYDEYYRDSTAITKENMITFLRANSDYKLKKDIEECQAKVLVLVGGRESIIMKKSAEILHKRIQNSSLENLSGYYHGDLSINHSELYIKKISELFTE